MCLPLFLKTGLEPTALIVSVSCLGELGRQEIIRCPLSLFQIPDMPIYDLDVPSRFLYCRENSDIAEFQDSGPCSILGRSERINKRLSFLQK